MRHLLALALCLADLLPTAREAGAGAQAVVNGGGGALNQTVTVPVFAQTSVGLHDGNFDIEAQCYANLATGAMGLKLAATPYVPVLAGPVGHAQVGASLPAGYSLSSASGVFLTSAVPEPAPLDADVAGLRRLAAPVPGRLTISRAARWPPRAPRRAPGCRVRARRWTAVADAAPPRGLWPQGGLVRNPQSTQ